MVAYATFVSGQGEWEKAMIDPNELLYIEPQRPEDPIPIIDNLTRRMTAALSHATAGGKSGNEFTVGDRFRGWHTCSCGATSSNQDYLLQNGMITNSLCIHYLARHRSEVPLTELRKVMALPPEETEPMPEQVSPDKFENRFRIVRTI